MEGEKKVGAEEKPEEMTEAPAIDTEGENAETRPTADEGMVEPKISQVLPDASWSTDRLSKAIRDPNMLVRSNAVMLLAQRGADEALEPLVQALKDDEYLVKSNAMVALASLGPSIAGRMIEALGDPEPGIRAGAAWVLGEFKEAKAVDALEKAANDENPLVRIQAKASLTAMGRRPAKKVEISEDAIKIAREKVEEFRAEEPGPEESRPEEPDAGEPKTEGEGS